MSPYRIRIGDAVATRHNARQLVTDRSLMVKNRDRWTVTAVHGDGSLTLVGQTGRVEVPPDYVQEHVERAYASTSQASQGRTVDRSFLFLDGGTNAAGIYVPMTRGRTSNDVFAVCQGEDTPADVVTESLSRSWIDRPAVARRAELAQANPEGGEGVASATACRPLGPKVLRVQDDAYTTSHRAAVAAIARLDRALGGQPEIEPPHQSLGISLCPCQARTIAAARGSPEYGVAGAGACTRPMSDCPMIELMFGTGGCRACAAATRAHPGTDGPR